MTIWISPPSQFTRVQAIRGAPHSGLVGPGSSVPRRSAARVVPPTGNQRSWSTTGSPVGRSRRKRTWVAGPASVPLIAGTGSHTSLSPNWPIRATLPALRGTRSLGIARNGFGHLQAGRFAPAMRTRCTWRADRDSVGLGRNASWSGGRRRAAAGVSPAAARPSFTDPTASTRR